MCKFERKTKIMQQKERIVFLDWLRFVACLMVMIVHACECIYSDDYSFSFPSESAKFAVLFFQSFVRPTAVPLFLMASAFLLVPVRQDTMTFFKKRFTRVLVPLLVFLPIYAVLPTLWGAQSWADAGRELLHCYINFPVSGSHLWFVYMLLGLYLVMPLISPWLDKASRKEELLFLGIWLFTCTFYRLRPLLGGAIFGECWWGVNAAFFYVSGFVGYILLAHFIRVHLNWDRRKIFSICIPVLAAMYAVCFFSGNYYSTRATTPAVMEQDWQNLTIIAVAMSFALFMLFSTIKKSGAFYEKVVPPVSKASYGMYLMHMLILPHWFRLFNAVLPECFTIPATALATYICCYLISSLISRLPFGKYIVG